MIKKSLQIALISMLLTSFSDAKVIFSGGAEDENPEQLPQKEIVDLIFNDTSINKEDLQLRKEQILECLKDANMKKTDTEKLLSAVKIPLGNNPNSNYYFVRGSQKNYCLAFYGAHTFQYWFVEVNDSKVKILLNNWSDGVDVLSSDSNGMKDIEAMGFYAAGLHENYDHYKFDGYQYTLSKCFTKNNSMKKPKKRKVQC